VRKGQRTLAFTQATFGGPMISNASLPDEALKDLLKTRRGALAPTPARSRANPKGPEHGPAFQRECTRLGGGNRCRARGAENDRLHQWRQRQIKRRP